jgi:hypothetical protein
LIRGQNEITFQFTFTMAFEMNTIVRDAEMAVVSSPRRSLSFDENIFDDLPTLGDDLTELDPDDMFAGCTTRYVSVKEWCELEKGNPHPECFARPRLGNARAWDCAEMDIFPFGRLGDGFCIECNMWYGWVLHQLFCTPTRCAFPNTWHTYKVGAPDDCARWFIPRMRMPRGRIGFTTVIMLDEQDQPIPEGIYTRCGESWVPIARH